METQGCARRSGLRALVTMAVLAATVVALPIAAAVAPAGATTSAAGMRRTALAPTVIRALHGSSQTSMIPPEVRSADRSAPKLSNFVISYNGFPAAAQAAVAYAAALWEPLIKSAVPIRVDATWSDLGSSGILGDGGPDGALADFPNAPHSNTYYASALADARAGFDLDPADPDIDMSFNSIAPWSTNTNGNITVNQWDLVSVAMHEIGHGLGIDDSFEINNGLGSWGFDGLPTSYDRLVATSSGTLLTSFGQNSSVLAQKLTSNAVDFIGGQAEAQFGKKPVPLYAPTTWSDGSSIAHLDEDTFPDGTPNALMTPFLDNGQVIQDPGDIVLGMLRDMGWVTTTARVTTPSSPIFTRVSAGSGHVDIAWSAPTNIGRSRVTSYELYRFTNGSATPDESFQFSAFTFSYNDTAAVNGTSYRYKLAATNDAGRGPTSGLSPVVIPLVDGPFNDVDGLINREFSDIVHRAPTTAEVLTYRTDLDNGTMTPGAFVVKLMQGTTNTNSVNPIIRLYLAYFKRLPDAGGLTFWSTKVRGGESKTIASNSFASSSEFKTTYGSLSNSAFVTLVYQNVLDRAPDTSGYNYWLGKLNTGYPRGSVMTGFSESSENITATSNEVFVVSLKFLLLGSIESTSDEAADQARLDNHTATPAVLAEEVVTSAAYYAHLGVPYPG
jgi:hypothetical protein